jgi:hypothetical protein
MRKRIFSAVLLLALLLSLGAAALADDGLPPLAPVAAPQGAEAVPVYLDGLLRGRAWAWGDMVYVDLKPLCTLFDIDMDWSGDGQRFTLTLGELMVEGEAGRQYFTADERYIYAPEDWLIFSGRLWLPVYAVCKLMNLESAWKDGALHLDASRFRLLRFRWSGLKK